MLLRYSIQPFLLLGILCLLVASSAWAQNREQVGWQEKLTAEQRQQVENIIADARPRIQELRRQVKEKVLELKTFAYNNSTDPNVLPRLGRELQDLRDALHTEIINLEHRISEVTGIDIHPRRGRGCAELSRSHF